MASTTCGQTCRGRAWPIAGIMIKREWGRAAAVWRPFSGGTSGSLSPWMTSVGIVSLPMEEEEDVACGLAV